MNLTEVRALAEAVRGQIAKAVVGQEEAVGLLLTALFCGGHVLLEGPPGAAKTFLAQCFARATGLQYGRIQFTPDLMPGDIIGASLFNFQASAFSLVKGPVFCELLLADEINRTPPKTQAALLEAMQERAVTIDGQHHALSDRFTVVATQNPIEHQGVYPLPEAQLDRFLFKHVIAYPSLEEERAVVLRHASRDQAMRPESFGVEPVGAADMIGEAMAAVAGVRLNDEIVDYVVALVRTTRDSGDLSVGASPRCSTMLARAARAHAALDGRDYVIPDDVKRLAIPALRHRVVLSPAAEIEGRTTDEAVRAAIERARGAAMIYPTARAVVLCALGAPMGLGLALAGGGLWLAGVAWTVAVMAAILVDALLGADRRRMRLELEAPATLALGHDGVFQLTARFEGRAPAMVELTAQASANAWLEPSRGRAAVDGRVATGRFVLRPRRRGQALLPRLWARWRGPLGLVFKQRSEACDYAAPIGLDLPRVKEEAARLISSNALMGTRLQYELGGASEFHALTDYQPGMERRLIDWKQSARHRTLLAREFEAERNHHVVMAIDTGRQMCEPVGGLPRIDRVLQAGLLLAFGALKGGDRVGLYAFDERPRLWSGLLSGQGAFPQVQKLAAHIDYSAAETNYTLGLTALGAHLQRRSLVVVFTEFTDSTTAELMIDNVARLLRTHLVLFVVIEDEELMRLERAPVNRPAEVSKAVLAGALARERELVMIRLRRMGADILQTPVEGLGPALLGRYLALKQTARL